MTDLRHPLAVLASRMPWQGIEPSVAHLFAHRVRFGKTFAGCCALLPRKGMTLFWRDYLRLRSVAGMHQK